MKTCNDSPPVGGPGCRVALATVVTVLAGLQGSAGLHLYDEKGQESAQEASTDLSQAGLAKALVGQCERIAEIAQHELEVVRRQGQVRRAAKRLVPIHGRSKAGLWACLNRDVAARTEVLAGMGHRDVRSLLVEVKQDNTGLNAALDS